MVLQLRPKPGQHYRLYLEEVIQDYEDGLLTATGLLYYVVGIYREPGHKLRLKDLNEIEDFCQQLGINRATFYRALSKLKVKKRLEWEAPRGINLVICPGSKLRIVPDRSDETDRKQPSGDSEAASDDAVNKDAHSNNTSLSHLGNLCPVDSQASAELLATQQVSQTCEIQSQTCEIQSQPCETQSQTCETQSQTCEIQSQTCEIQTSKPLPAEDSGNSPNLLATPLQIFINSLSLEARERFLNFCQREVQNFSRPIVSLPDYLGAIAGDGKPRFQSFYERFCSTEAGKEARDESITNELTEGVYEAFEQEWRTLDCDYLEFFRNVRRNSPEWHLRLKFIKAWKVRNGVE